MATYFRQFLPIYIRSNSDHAAWEEVLLLWYDAGTRRWAVLDSSEGVCVKDFARLSSRPFRPTAGAVLSLATRPSGSDLQAWADYGKELLQGPSAPHAGAGHFINQPGSAATAHIPQLPYRDPPGRGRARSRTHVRVLSEPANPRRGSRTSRSEDRPLLGLGFEHFAKRAIRSFVSGQRDHAEVIDPRTLGLQEADLVLRLKRSVQACDLLPRQFVWRTPQALFEASSIIVFEMKLTSAGAQRALQQQRDRERGLSAEPGATIHLGIIMNADGYSGFLDPGVHWVFTTFVFEQALQSEHELAGFRASSLPQGSHHRPSIVVNSTVPNNGDVLEEFWSGEAMSEALADAHPDSAVPRVVPGTSWSSHESRGAIDTREPSHPPGLDPPSPDPLLHEHAGGMPLAHFVGSWVDNQGGRAHVDSSWKMSLTSAAGKQLFAKVKQRNDGNFICGPYTVLLSESHRDRIVWLGPKGKVATWLRIQSP